MSGGRSSGGGGSGGRSRTDRRLFMGNLPSRVNEDDIRDFLRDIGPIVSVIIKQADTRSPYAFVEFEHYRDIELAIDEKDGVKLRGSRVRAEMSKVDRRRFFKRDYRYERPGVINSRDNRYAMLVTGLPETGSWQDLKDHLRDRELAFSYVDVGLNGTGYVSFKTEEDMDLAIKKCHGITFCSHKEEKSKIHAKVFPYLDRSRSRSASRSRSRSPVSPESFFRRRQRAERERSKSRSKSRSLSNDKNKTRSRSRSYENYRRRSRSPTPKKCHRKSQKDARKSRSSTPEKHIHRHSHNHNHRHREHHNHISHSNSHNSHSSSRRH